MEALGRQAVAMIEDGFTVGLGTGRAATAFVQALGAGVEAGLVVRGVPTSRQTAELAAGLGIPLVALAKAGMIDITFDGADEVDPQLDVIKGYGGALVREKIVAASSLRLVILVGSEKLVPVLGMRGKLPIEVVPFGLELCRRRLAALGHEATPRLAGEELLVTDNGNHILDCAIQPLEHLQELETKLLAIPGVVGTGLFLGMADTVLIADDGAVEVRRRTVS